MKSAWETYVARQEHWRAKNRFYHAYVDALIAFLVPDGRRSYIVENPFEPFTEEKAQYDYVVVSDRLGYVYDIQDFFEQMQRALTSDGRVVITQYSALWEPVLRLASFLRLRSPSVEQNWISPHDIRTFLELAGFETIRSGSKLLFPKYIPLVSAFLNAIVVNLWPFSYLGLVHYVVARPLPKSKKEQNPSLSIIVPARNEKGTIERIANELPLLGSFTEIIFIEGNSTDDTRAEIERVTREYTGKKKISFAVQEGKGKGDAVRKGFAMATGDILTIYDADMTVPSEEVGKFYTTLVHGYGDFINGSRLVYPVEEGAMRLFNIFGNKFFSLAFSALLGQYLKDTLCGTKMLWRKDYETIAANRAFFGDFDPFGDFDLLFGAAKLNLKIIDLPVHYRDRVYGTTNISRWRHGWMLLKMVIFVMRKMRFR